MPDKTPEETASETGATTPSESRQSSGKTSDVFPNLDSGEEATVLESMVGEQLRDEEGGRNIDAMLNVALDVQIVLGRSRMPIAQLLKLSRGSVIELDKKIGEPVEVVINDRLVARGDLVKVAEDRLGVTLTEIVKDYVAEQ